MPIGHDFDELLWDRVAVSTLSTYSAYGTPSHSTSAAVSYRAYVEFKRHNVLSDAGEEVVASSIVYLGGSSSGALPPALQTQDKITLSSVWGSSSQAIANPRILAVDRYADESSGRYVTVAHCG